MQYTENECRLPDLDAANLVLEFVQHTAYHNNKSECATECASQLLLHICIKYDLLCASDAHNGATASLVSTPNCAEISCSVLYPPVRGRECHFDRVLLYRTRTHSNTGTIGDSHKEMHVRTTWNFESCRTIL